MSTRMKESEAWLAIAERIEDGKWLQRGLCRETIELWLADKILYEMRSRMTARIREYVGETVGHREPSWPFAFDPGTHAEERILAALWLALEAEESEEPSHG